MAESRPSPPLPREAGFFLLATAALGLAPFVPYLPWSLSLLAALLLLWRGVLVWRDAPPPARFTLLLAAALGIVLTVASYHTIFGKQAGLSLLSMLLPLKLLEARTRRDGRAALLLCCFLLTGQFLNAQSMAVAAFVLLCATAIVATSAKLEQPGQAPRGALRTALRLLGGAVPLMLLLFVLFPRINGPLWGMPLDAYAGSTGLSDSMRPGSISELIQSGEIAFRVEFEGTPPAPAQRYWRGPVLSEFDGQEWKVRESMLRRAPTYTVAGPAYRYSLTLEPHNRGWLLALDYPDSGAADALYGDDLVLLARRPVRNRVRYNLTSFPETPVGLQERENVLKAALRLPPASNPRTSALGAGLQAGNAEPAARVEAALRFMREARLAYTLSPPLLGQHPADEFLFDTKRGFCEHFAGSFVVLMRAAGVPARVVTGYQGGEFNPVDGTLVVRQSDAHAWAEVWLAGRGWQRVDPTAASFPRRIDEGIARALPEGEAMPIMLRQNFEFLRSLRYRWEAISNGWNQWVLGYNAQRQLDLMRSLGLPDADWRQLAGLLAACASAWLLWLGLRLWPRHARLDALDRCWRRLCRKLARQGVRHQPWEAPGDFARRAAAALPQHADTIIAIAEHYATLRYGPGVEKPATQLAALRAAVQQFRP
ncbi:DUF3488 and transglutaminase-like domain-containing protein [Uliginosibacterium sp. 31-16]|uniref:transglutaminase TgpA family protein n=1 Tax=Uliginosibacterium sp. 31-16 TaxID=3068315 RepID=UPI00273F2F4D|nr:DUF3488 and transglutaminase-like domain-containing protein [Uliginosibacterium sp. 31-16]MDP5241284.1 DUF3488 and transglutaminase-like domain-containing protein [Uliginosibacterium sp. 31-16]